MTDPAKVFSPDHPFLDQPGSWFAAGHGMTGDPLDRVPIQGLMQISHEGGKILNRGQMTIVSRTNPVTFQVSYELSPSGDDQVLDFFQANQSVGNLKGKVVVFDDRLVSTYSSGDGSLTGWEVLHRMGENRYAATGSLLEEGRLTNLWKLDLVRPASEGTTE